MPAARSACSIACVSRSLGTNDATGVQSREELMRLHPIIADQAIRAVPRSGVRRPWLAALRRSETLGLDLGRRVVGRLQHLLGGQCLGGVVALAFRTTLDRNLELERARGQVEAGRGRI